MIRTVLIYAAFIAGAWSAIATGVAIAIGRVIKQRDAAPRYLNILDEDRLLYVEHILEAKR